MRTALYIDDGVTQVVLTPDTEWEKSVVQSLVERKPEVKVMQGAFYSCRGGWVRNNIHEVVEMTGRDEMSLIIVVQPPKPTP